MMKGSRRLVTSLLALSALAAQAAPVTVVEVSEAGGAAPVQPHALSVQNEMFFMLQQLQDEVRGLRGIVEQQQYRLDLLERQQKERYRDMDKRIGLLYRQLPPEAGTAPAAVTDMSGEQEASGIELPRTAPEAEASSSQEEGGVPGAQAAYEAAFARVRAREFEAAEAQLKSFIDKYPGNALQANAWYWLGEVHLAQGKVSDSQAAFSHVVEVFGRHGKAADALYKLGVLADRAGDMAGATQLMQRVVQEYPQAPAANLARGYLKL